MRTSAYLLESSRSRTSSRGRAGNRWETTVVDNGIRVQIGVSRPLVGRFYPLVDTTGADRIRPFAIAEIRMIGDLLLGRR